MLNFFLTGRYFLCTTTIYNIYFLCTKSLSRSCCIHRYVTGTDNGNTLADLDRCWNFALLITLHQIDTCQELICGIYAKQVLARNAKEVWKSGTRSKKYCVKSACKQIIHGQRTSDYNICLKIYTKICNILQFLCNQRLRKTELRNTIAQHATSLM